MSNQRKSTGKVVGGESTNSTMADAEGVWKGFDPYSHLFRDIALTNFRSDDEALGKRGVQRTEVLSLQPRAFLYPSFLSKEECEYLIELGTPHMTGSRVRDRTTGRGIYSSARTSTGTYLKRGGDEVIRDIEKRIAEFTFIPVEHGEGLHVLHYEAGQKFDPHFDTSIDGIISKNGGPRMATVVMYLSDVEEGGETVFPRAKGKSSQNEVSASGKKGLSVKPKMGDALLFWNVGPDGKLDPYSKHGGSPVIKGNKWSCTKWLHVGELKMTN